MWVEVKIKYTTVLIGLVYMPPRVKKETLEEFHNHLLKHNISEYDKNLLIVGDFNLYAFSNPQLIEEDSTSYTREEILRATCNFFNLESHNTIRNDYNRILDLVLFRNYNNPNVKRSLSIDVQGGEPIVKEVPDHPALEINFYLRKNNSNKESIPIPKQNINPNAESKSSRNDIHFFSDKNFNYTNVDFDSLSNHINNLNYSSVLQTNEPDTSLERFYSILYSGIEEHVPKRRPGTIQINKKKYPTWWSRQTIATVKQKEKLRRKKMCNDGTFKQLKKRCQKLIKTELKNYTKELQNKLKSNAKKEFWNFIN
uniref:Endonuclease/exonuclease/phosphatase domain-containing protein n=1 Tax=Cacopsylla melanoneura TaxID=428564 RepID=A0A8D8M961_9HEMI